MSRTILLADDSVTIQKVIELTFMDDDYRVVAVGDGDQALEHLDGEIPDVVIADVHMPGANGYDVARHAKSRRSDLPVLLLVGTFEPFDEDEAARSGADRHLKKPFDSQELQRLVEEMLASGGSGGGAAARDEAPAAPPTPPTVACASEADDDVFGDLDAAPPAASPFSIGDLDDDETPSPSQVLPPDDEADGWGSQGEPAVAEESLEAVAEPERPAPAAAPAGESFVFEESEPPAPTRVSPPPAEAPAAGEAGSEAREAAAGPGLSDADVDRIARRIVELLGDEAVRDVAWEVIPDMAEVVIRDRLRELESQVES